MNEKEIERMENEQAGDNCFSEAWLKNAILTEFERKVLDKLFISKQKVKEVIDNLLPKIEVKLDDWNKLKKELGLK